MTADGRRPSEPVGESLWGLDENGRPTFDGEDICPCHDPGWTHTDAAHSDPQVSS